MARLVSDESSKIIDNLIVLGKDVCAISAVDVEFEDAKSDTFQTDTAISGHSGDIRERELRPWTSEEPVDVITMDLNSRAGKNWDQFAVNEKLFGVTTDYQEEIYTTKLDKSDPNFKKREAEAERLAREIERVRRFRLSGTS